MNISTTINWVPLENLSERKPNEINESLYRSNPEKNNESGYTSQPRDINDEN